MGWERDRGQGVSIRPTAYSTGGRGFPRLQARIYELRRSVSVQELNTSMAKGDAYDAHYFAYSQALAEIEEIEELLAWYGAWASRRPWAGWQSWLVLGMALVSGILSVLAIWPKG